MGFLEYWLWREKLIYEVNVIIGRINNEIFR